MISCSDEHEVIGTERLASAAVLIRGFARAVTPRKARISTAAELEGANSSLFRFLSSDLVYTAPLIIFCSAGFKLRADGTICIAHDHLSGIDGDWKCKEEALHANKMLRQIESHKYNERVQLQLAAVELRENKIGFRRMNPKYHAQNLKHLHNAILAQGNEAKGNGAHNDTRYGNEGADQNDQAEESNGRQAKQHHAGRCENGVEQRDDELYLEGSTD